MDACHAHQDACTSQQQLLTSSGRHGARQRCWGSGSHEPPAASRAELARLSRPHDPIEATRTSVRSCQRARCRATAANSAVALFCLQISRISLFYHSGCMPNFNLTPQAASAFPRTPNPSVWDRLTRGGSNFTTQSTRIRGPEQTLNQVLTPLSTPTRSGRARLLLFLIKYITSYSCTCRLT